VPFQRIAKTYDAGAFQNDAFAVVDYVAEPFLFDGGAFDSGAFDAPLVLLFNQPPAESADLLFTRGLVEASDATISGTLSAPVPLLSSDVRLGFTVSGALFAGVPVLSGEVIYSTQTARPLVARAVVRFQDAEPQYERAAARNQDAQRLPHGWAVRHQDAAPLGAGVELRHQDAKRLRNGPRIQFQDGVQLPAGAQSKFQNAVKSPNGQRVRFQGGIPRGLGLAQHFQDGVRNPNALHLVRYQDARPCAARLFSQVGSGRPINRGWGTRYQEAWAPRPGRYTPPVVPPADPCYLPNPALLFATPYTFGQGAFGAEFDPGAFHFRFQAGEADLLFVCERHDPVDPGEPETVVIPVRRIYTVINSATLTRVDNGEAIPTVGMSLAIDVDSWTWSFTARTPGAALPLLARGPDRAPVEVEAMINGAPYRALIEGISRDRSFARSDLSITGRGKAAVLDAPYSPLMTFGNPSEPRTVQQLANDVLTFNGVSLGWNVDDAWAPDDWLVPAGVFSHQGSYISAINAIAGAAGAYVQPHATAKALRVLRRYPAAPWDWGDVTPDYELPAAVVTKEGTTWLDKPTYNRVYVRGMKSGIVGQATRLGTDGGLEAPMVTDQLITNAIGARQRALPVLADVGSQATVSLRLPVLNETGIITPGKFVRYVDDGVATIGLVRSTSAEVQRADKKLTIWQTIGVETHVNV